MTSERAEHLAAHLVEFFETGLPPAGLLTGDVFCDLTSPRWRDQAQGVGAVVALRQRGHPGPSRVRRTRCDPTPNGFVLELEEEWEDGSETWYSRELVRADVASGAIAELAVYCTGDWDRSRRNQHAREVRLLRP
jgi:hypothetical protein